MKRTKYFAIAFSILIVSALFAIFLINKNKHPKISDGLKKEIVKKFFVVKNSPFEKKILTNGRMYAYNRFDIYAEVSGQIKKSQKPLRGGTFYRQDEVIVKIDDSIFRNQLFAKKSALLNQLTLLLPDLKYDFPGEYDKWLKYLDNFNVEKTLPPLPQISSEREKYYLASKNILQSFYEIKSAEATYVKYFIRAPYDGYLTQSLLREGDMVRAGQKIGTFVGSGLFEMQAAVSTNEIKFVKKGMRVFLSEYKSEKKIEGKISRINPSVSPESQSVYVYIQTRDSKVRDGAFYNVIIPVKVNFNAAKIPKKAFDAENFVFIETESGLKRIKPEIIDETPLFYFVKDLKDGTKILLNNL